MATIYIVHSYLTNSQEYFSEEMLEQYFPELKSGELEVIDEIDTEE